MKDQLQTALAGLVQRHESLGRAGLLASESDIKQLQDTLGIVLPPWFGEMLTTYPLGGAKLGLPSRAEEGEVDWMEWSSAQGIISESAECYPGVAVLKAKWINVASCSLGSGDPYFVPLDQTDDPPLYQVFHERYIGNTYGEIQGFQYHLVSDSLSGFFRSVILD